MTRTPITKPPERPGLHLDDVAAALGFAPATLRAAKAVTAPDMRSHRRSGTIGGARGRGRVYAIEDVVSWLRRVLPRLDPETELALRRAAQKEGTAE